jgi:hypothetical protein
VGEGEGLYWEKSKFPRTPAGGLAGGGKWVREVSVRAKQTSEREGRTSKT